MPYDAGFARVSFRMTQAGLPAATENAGTSVMTTLLDPTIAPSPIVTPCAMQEPRPIQARVQMRVGRPACGFERELIE